MIFKCCIFFHHSKEINTSRMFSSPLHWISLWKLLGQRVQDTNNVLFSESHIFCGSLTPPIAIRFPALSRRLVRQETQREQESCSSPAEPRILMKLFKCRLPPRALWAPDGPQVAYVTSKCLLHPWESMQAMEIQEDVISPWGSCYPILLLPTVKIPYVNIVSFDIFSLQYLKCIHKLPKRGKNDHQKEASETLWVTISMGLCISDSLSMHWKNGSGTENKMQKQKDSWGKMIERLESKAYESQNKKL